MTKSFEVHFSGYRKEPVCLTLVVAASSAEEAEREALRQVLSRPIDDWELPANQEEDPTIADVTADFVMAFDGDPPDDFLSV